MPLRIDPDFSPPHLVLSGVVTIEEADELLEAFAQHPDAVLDLSECEHLHTAPLQLLKLRQTTLVAPPADQFWLRCLGILAQSVAAEAADNEEIPSEQSVADNNKDSEDWGVFE